MKRLVVATRNLAKGGEMVLILRSLLPDWEIRTLLDYPSFPEPEETGTTYAENAIIKALAAASAIGALCIADDAGLEVDALDGAPGVFSKRFGGEEMPFPQKIELILASLSDVRSARFRCCVAVATPGMETRVFEATKEGVIADAPRGQLGFGYDPVFILPELGKTYAELSPEEKNKISHRFMVLHQAARHLSTVGTLGA